MSENPVSTHIFLFPFSWELSNESKSLKESLRSEQCKNMGWKESTYNNFNDCLDYNEYQYFYQFVRDILFGKGEESDAVFHHFSFKEDIKMKFKILINSAAIKSENNKNVKYEIDISDIMLNVYDFNVGVLSIHCKNYNKNHTDKDILAINQFGRRLFPPFLIKNKFCFEMPESISISVKDGKNYKAFAFENFRPFRNQSNNISLQLASWLPKHITCLLPVEEHFIQEILDDRMYVLSWYGAGQKLLDDLSKYNQKENKYGFQKNDFWYKYIFMDVNEKSCWNEIENEKILTESSYARWINYYYPDPYSPKTGIASPTLYGISRYSFVTISSPLNEIPKIHTNTMYYKLVELCLVQRAAVIRFSNDVSLVSKDLQKNEVKTDANTIKELYKKYILFINKVYFREVTSQDQGIELYNKIQSAMNIPRSVTDLDTEFQELHQFVAMEEQSQQTKKATELSKLAAIFLPATLLASILGFFSDKEYNFAYKFDCYLSVLLITFVVLVVLALKFHEKMNLLIEKLSNKISKNG